MGFPEDFANIGERLNEVQTRRPGGERLMRDHTLLLEPGVSEAAGLNFSCGIRQWDPRLKLSLLAAAIAVNVLVAVGWLSALLLSCGLALALWSRIPLKRFLLFFMAPLWATTLVFVGFSMGFGATPLFHVGPYPVYREGMLMGLSAAARVASDMSWMAVIFLTTPFPGILEALRWFKIPEPLVEAISMAYRYTSLLSEQYYAMRDALRARGGFRTFRTAIQGASMILARIISSAYDRADHIHSAMIARGSSASQNRPDRTSPPEKACPNKCDVTPPAAGEAGPLLSCADVAFSYPARDAMSLNGVSFQLRRGDVALLCGPNGAGKTTLLKTLAGILPAQKGEITIAGRPLDRKTKNDVFRNIGILFEDPNNQLFCPSVREDIEYGPKNLGLDNRTVERLVNTAMDLMEVNHLADRPVHTLSHGEMKRVGLAGLIAMRPPLLLLDEPTVGLDPAAASHLVDLIRHLNKTHGYTFLIVTHDIDLAPRIANRIIILDRGRVAADGDARDILTDMELLERTRLEPPLLTRLFSLISGSSSSTDRPPITIEEAAELLRNRNAS